MSAVQKRKENHPQRRVRLYRSIDEQARRWVSGGGWEARGREGGGLTSLLAEATLPKRRGEEDEEGLHGPLQVRSEGT